MNNETATFNYSTDACLLENETVATLTTHDDGGVPEEVYSANVISRLSNIQQSWGDHGHRDLIDFLSRPVRVAVGTWTSAQAVNTPLATLTFPDELMKRALISNKLDGFTFLHAGIRLHIELTAQPTQAGMLLVNYIPYEKYTPTLSNAIKSTITGKSGCPSQIINLASATGPKFITPYISPRSAYNLATGSGSLGTITLSVLTKLVSSGASTVNYSIFASFDKPLPSTPTAAKNSIVPPALQAQIGDAIIKPAINLCEDDGDDRYHLEAQIGGELQSRQQSGTISGMARAVSAVAASIPPSLGLGAITKPVEWISNATASVASYFGFSKPTSQVPITKVKQQPVSYMINSDGVDSSHKIALMANNELETDPALFATSDDEMSISNLVTRPVVLSPYNWKKTDAAGASLFDIAVTPSQLYVLQDSVNKYSNGGYAWFLSQQFGLWRGDLVYTFHFAKTKFHSGRIRAAYYPYANANNSNLQDIDTMMTYAKTEIFDLSSADSFTFTVPFTSSTDWKLTTQSATYTENNTGKFILEVLNPLVAPDIVASSVDYVLVAHGAANLEFAMPIKQRTRPNKFNPPAELNLRARRSVLDDTVGTNLPPLSNNISEKITDLDAQIGSLNCFIGNRNVEVSANDPLRKSKKLKVKSPMAEVDIDTLTETESSSPTLEAQIGAQPTLQRSRAHEYVVEHPTNNMVPHARTVGEVVPSLRALGKRFQRVVKDASVPSGSLVQIKPWSKATTPLFPDFFAHYREVFQFYRGSMRLKIFVTALGENSLSLPLTVYTSMNSTTDGPVYYSNTNTFISYTEDANQFTALNLFSDSFKVFLDKEGAVEIDVAYYSHFPMCFSSDATDQIPDSGYCPFPIISIEGLDDCKIDVYRAIGDDFSFGTPLGLPPMKTLTY